MPRRSALALATLIAASNALAGDLAGVYQCTGHDAKEGEYKATVTLTADAAQAAGGFSGYKLRMEVPGYGVYLGSVAAKGDDLAITFTHTDPSTKDYGTGLGTVTHAADGGIGFRKYYYEPEFKGGDHGTEECQRKR